MDTKSVLEVISKENDLVAYGLVWFDGSGEHFLVGGNGTVALGLMTYGAAALKKHQLEVRPLSLVTTDPTATQKPGTA